MQDIEAAREAGFDFFLAKPADPEKILKIVRDYAAQQEGMTAKAEEFRAKGGEIYQPVAAGTARSET